jgi:hypothetical protein
VSKGYLSVILWLVGITYPTDLFGQGNPSLPTRTIIPGESDPHVARMLAMLANFDPDNVFSRFFNQPGFSQRGFSQRELIHRG